MRTGLRTEIVVSICLLLGAALLFAGFLLVKLTEQELLAQRLQQARTTAGLIRKAFALTDQVSTALPDQPLAARTQRGLRLLHSLPDLSAWRLLDGQQQVLASLSETGHPDFAAPRFLTGSGELDERLTYSSSWFPGFQPPASHLDLSFALDETEFAGAVLQIRFSLQDLVARVHRSQRLVLVYVVVYGLVLALFGIFLLNRNLVQPIRRLQQATAEVASGSLAPVAGGTGPLEITELSNSFNRMVAALEQSRAETQAQIRSLELTNQALQQARDDLLRSEKMASVGHLAAGMAHEIGNPLAALIGYLGILGNDLERPADQDLVRRALTETGRIDTLIRELLDYAAPGSGAIEPVCPLAVLRETIDMLTHQGQFEGVTIEDRCSQLLVRVGIDRQRLQQVWVNLLLNARDAMDGVGRIVIDSRLNGRLSISISDQGPGIADDRLTRIFEPFYTTKAPGKGRGLGLAVCQRIIDQAGGRILVDSDGNGATFTVCLPPTKTGEGARS